MAGEEGVQHEKLGFHGALETERFKRPRDEGYECGERGGKLKDPSNM